LLVSVQGFKIDTQRKVVQPNKYSTANNICCLGSTDAAKEGAKRHGYITFMLGLLNEKKYNYLF